MLRSYYINKAWMLSSAARRAYRAAATLSVALFFLIVGLPFVRTLPAALAPLMKLLVFAGILGAAVTLVAMEYFFFGFDDASSANRLLWFLVMLLPLLGAPLYCFFVYSRQAQRMAAGQTAPRDGSPVGSRTG